MYKRLGQTVPGAVGGEEAGTFPKKAGAAASKSGLIFSPLILILKMFGAPDRPSSFGQGGL